jgi:AraC-like DNA-binding protein
MDVQPHLLNLSAYINQNLEKDLPLSSLAKRVGLSPFHFHRKFGAYFGESLHQHIKRLRLERAAYALTHQSTPVRQIARDSGYKTVSAFSHAFSGFAGESPTRYRSLSSGRRTEPVVAARSIEPAWIGTLAPLEMAFVRALGVGRGGQRSIREAIEQIEGLIGGLPIPGRPTTGSDDAPHPDRFAFIAATSDFYGVSNGGEYRLDVGLDAARVPPDRVTALGVQTLPGGRYARFDFHCMPSETIDNCLAAALHGLRDTKETPRLSQYFLRFDGEAHGEREREEPRDYRFFVPLAD